MADRLLLLTPLVTAGLAVAVAGNVPKAYEASLLVEGDPAAPIELPGVTAQRLKALAQAAGQTVNVEVGMGPGAVRLPRISARLVGPSPDGLTEAAEALGQALHGELQPRVRSATTARAAFDRMIDGHPLAEALRFGPWRPLKVEVSPVVQRPARWPTALMGGAGLGLLLLLMGWIFRPVPVRPVLLFLGVTAVGAGVGAFVEAPSITRVVILPAAAGMQPVRDVRIMAEELAAHLGARAPTPVIVSARAMRDLSPYHRYLGLIEVTLRGATAVQADSIADEAADEARRRFDAFLASRQKVELARADAIAAQLRSVAEIDEARKLRDGWVRARRATQLVPSQLIGRPSRSPSRRRTDLGAGFGGAIGLLLAATLARRRR